MAVEELGFESVANQKVFESKSLVAQVVKWFIFDYSAEIPNTVKQKKKVNT